MSPISAIYVSSVAGNNSNTGAIDAPLLTIPAGIALAESSRGAGKPWHVVVLSGQYDDQIAGVSGNPAYIHLMDGAEVAYSSGPTVTDASGSVYIWMHRGASLFCQDVNGSPVVYLNGGDVEIYGNGDFFTAGYALVENAGGNFLARGIRCGSDNNLAEMFAISGGTTVLQGCKIRQKAAASAFYKTGGDLKLAYCEIQSNHSDYISAPSAQAIQLVHCVSNVAKDSNSSITEDVSTMLVNSGFTI